LDTSNNLVHQSEKKKLLQGSGPNDGGPPTKTTPLGQEMKQYCLLQSKNTHSPYFLLKFQVNFNEILGFFHFPHPKIGTIILDVHEWPKNPKV